MQYLKKEFGLTYLLIDHNLPLVRYFCDRVAVMYLGKIVEIAVADELFNHPKHPYTKALLSAIPKLDPDEKRERINLKGEVPSAINPPKGCRFHTRCPYKTPECEKVEPNLISVGKDHLVACHLIK